MPREGLTDEKITSDVEPELGVAIGVAEEGTVEDAPAKKVEDFPNPCPVVPVEVFVLPIVEKYVLLGSILKELVVEVCTGEAEGLECGVVWDEEVMMRPEEVVPVVLVRVLTELLLCIYETTTDELDATATEVICTGEVNTIEVSEIGKEEEIVCVDEVITVKLNVVATEEIIGEDIILELVVKIPEAVAREVVDVPGVH